MGKLGAEMPGMQTRAITLNFPASSTRRGQPVSTAELAAPGAMARPQQQGCGQARSAGGRTPQRDPCFPGDGLTRLCELGGNSCVYGWVWGLVPSEGAGTVQRPPACQEGEMDWAASPR
ncbi:hypothetical protein SKAU_G00162010 [Synaphobranchus kaupii]|uniref:Uncharacterized protein n=1 Tax=Synaphobranchus kaupii TaxID=118154 RepID=A0A9Q1FIV4_SYNKA|nr:hypothetical protein SKAU_G00162010 [Synaphobranchus kaupii]